MKLKLIEPLKEFFKDEVRILGKSLNLDQNINAKHPFPGPGLGIRVIGKITLERLILQEADHIYISELKKVVFIEKFGRLMLPYFQLKQLG